MNKRKSVFLSAITGNILEYYDFTVYSVFSVAIGHTFFPNSSEVVQILSSLAVFAVGFVTRPIGGILFGYIGDKYGRKKSLIMSMLGMTIPTFVMGLIPSYEEIGLYAPTVLVLMRLTQGLCLSGEGAGVAIFVLEHYKNKKPGLITGITHGSNILGTLLASGVGIIISKYYTGESHAWRYAFMLGGFFGLCGLYLRLKVGETPIFQELAKAKKILKAPFLHVLETAKPQMFLTFCTGGVTSSIVYLVKTYVNVFYSTVMHLDETTSLMYLAYASFILMIAMVIAGAAVDYVGRLRVIVTACVTIIFLSIPTLLIMAGETTMHHLVALTMLALMAGAVSGSAYIFVISLFTPEQRFTGVAFSYNLGIATFGGTSAMISRWLVQNTGLYYAPALYIMLTASLYLFVLYKMRAVAMQNNVKAT